MAPLKDLWHWSKPLLKTEGFTDKTSDTRYPPGLICLKGGDLAQEISDSGVKPRMVEISSLFEEEYFKEKYLLYVKK